MDLDWWFCTVSQSLTHIRRVMLVAQLSAGSSLLDPALAAATPCLLLASHLEEAHGLERWERGVNRAFLRLGHTGAPRVRGGRVSSRETMGCNQHIATALVRPRGIGGCTIRKVRACSGATVCACVCVRVWRACVHTSSPVRACERVKTSSGVVAVLFCCGRAAQRRT